MPQIQAALRPRVSFEGSTRPLELPVFAFTEAR